MTAVSGLNHITLAVRDLERSFNFYTTALGLRPVARWDRGAHLLAGETWICLNLDQTAAAPDPRYTHIAFSVPPDHFTALTQNLLAAGVLQWQQNHSEGDSFYCLDPDDYKLEIHTTHLHDRLASMHTRPPSGWQTFDPLPPQQGAH